MSAHVLLNLLKELGKASHFISFSHRGSYMSAHVLLNLLKELGQASHFISFSQRV